MGHYRGRVNLAQQSAVIPSGPEQALAESIKQNMRRNSMEKLEDY
jgi:hypothetical protein